MSYALNDRPTPSVDFQLSTSTIPASSTASSTATAAACRRLERAERTMAQLNGSWLVINRYGMVVDSPPDATLVRSRFVTFGGESIPSTQQWIAWAKHAVADIEDCDSRSSSVAGHFVVPGGLVCAVISRDSLPNHFLVSLRYAATEDRQAAVEGRGLTRRETQVSEELLKGLTNAEIARELGISERTVHKHVENIFAKLNIHSRAQLFELARR
jgi:DNA-binding CsgD family transcriptional regulator